MGGLHACYRGMQKNVASSYKYIGASTTVILPSSCGYKANDAKYKGGVFPEFFHGFYRELGLNKGVDTGIIYKDGAFRLFMSGDNVPWSTEEIKGVSFRTQVVLKTYLENGKIISKCLSTSNQELAKIEQSLPSATYQGFMKGCRINREMCLAANEVHEGEKDYVFEGTNAFYKDATMKKTTLTTTNWEFIALSNGNSITKSPEVDHMNSIPSSIRIKPTITVTESGGFIADTSSATADYRVNPV